MRLVAWNANYNNRRRSVEQDLALLRGLCPDVVVLSETGAPRASHPTIHTFGAEPPFLAVATFGAYHADASPINKGAPTLGACFRISGPTEFTLGAFWPVKRAKSDSYPQLLASLLKHFADDFGAGPTIIAGDLNTSTKVSNQKRTHPKFVREVQDLGLESAYHHHAGEPHGLETQATYVQGSARPRRFHLDYCFVPSGMVSAAVVTIPRSGLWSKLSDHYPVVLDIPDAAFPK